MARLSLGEIWDETRLFIGREAGLLVPVALATYGAAQLILELAMPHRGLGMHVAAGSWMLWLIPCLLLTITGDIALSRLALRPRTSVGESLRDAFGLLPRALGLMALMIGIGMVLILAAALLGIMLKTLMGISRDQAAMLGVVMLLPPVIWIGVRLALLWPAVAAGVGGVTVTLSHAMAVTRGHVASLLGLMLVKVALYLLLAVAVQAAGGSVVLLLARLLGASATGEMLVAVLMAAFNALFMMLWAVLFARIYARLAG